MNEDRRNKNELNIANTVKIRYLCEFMSEIFLQTYYDQNGISISQNKYASLCGLSFSTHSKLKSTGGYNIPMTTIYNICRHEKYSLKKLFAEFESIYGITISE